MNILDLAEFEEINTENFDGIETDITVVVNTYNYAHYLKDTFDGILSQENNYRMEVLIHDDCSTDNSADIIREYCIHYPFVFHGYIGHKNIYGSYDIAFRANFFEEWLRASAHGRYLALCEGDDYWINPNKLQLQISYMDEHRDCYLTMHNALLKDYRNKTERLMKDGELEHDISPQELILQSSGIWPTASMVFSKELLSIPIWFLECGLDDWPRQLYALTKGKVHFFSNCMSVYRYMHTGSWSESVAKDQIKRMEHTLLMLRFLFKYDRFTYFQFHGYICERAGRYYMDQIWNACSESEYLSLIINAENRLGVSFDKIRNSLLCVYKLIRDESWLTDEITNFFARYEHVYVMGTGKLSGILSSKLDKREMIFDGYIVSDGEAISSSEKSVYHLSDITNHECMRCGVIVAIGFQFYSDISKSLRSRHINYITPFVIG